jgi:5-(carboxyamino)imidazole ribonucleotide synthase
MTTVGVLGGGQLGRMLALAGFPLGLRFRFLDPDPKSPAGQIAPHIVGRFDDPDCLTAFASGLDVVTYEFENVPVELAGMVACHCPVLPPPAALAASQDRVNEKDLFGRLGVPTAPYARVDDDASLDRAIDVCGYPSLLKTRRLGYDGKGQYLLRGPSDRAPALTALGGTASILEGYVDFDRELSLIAVRSAEGALAFYPLVENHHAGGILRTSLAPAPAGTAQLQRQAEAHVGRILNELGYVGVLAVEFFEMRGQLIANEMAPRVHNSGHWSIEGAETSQFENHLRAVLGLPIGSTQVHLPCAMLNLIGKLPDSAKVLAVPDAHLHLYGKAPRAGRKLGHVTIRATSEDTLRQRIARVQALLGSGQKAGAL